MSSANFTFPTNQGEFMTYTQAEFNSLKFYAYGIYRCKISNTNNQLFKPFKNNHYTNYDLLLINLLNKNSDDKIKIEIIQDNEPNAILYKTDRLQGNKTFKSFSDLLYTLKQKKIAKTSKLLINALWGSLSQKKIIKANIKNTDTLNLESGTFINLLDTDKEYTKVEYGHIDQIFKSNYARIGCFLTSYCRFKFMEIIIKNNLYNNVIRINTDSVLFSGDIPTNIKISDELGDFKIEQQGNCVFTDMRLKPQFS